jgi:hypothetical protein
MINGMLDYVNEVHLDKYQEIIGHFSTKMNHCIRRLI